MAYDIGPKIGIEGEKEFRNAINGITTNMKTLGTEMMAVTSQFDKNDKSTEALTAKNKVLNKQIDEQKNKLSELVKGLDASSNKYGENDKVTQGWQQSVNKATAELNNMERELGQNTKAMEEASDKGNKLDKMLGNTDSSLNTFAKSLGGAALTGIKVLGTAMVGALTGLVALNKGTEEYRNDLSKLEQNATDSGNSFDYMKGKLGELNALTGETDSSIEALSNLMAGGFNDNQMENALDALSGAVIKFPDTLKIEGLADGLQETLATGEAVGTFAELMERMGGDTEKFNEAMAAATTEAEKQEVALKWLAESGLSEVNEKYKETNKEAIANAESQFKFNDAMAGLGDIITPLITMLTGHATPAITELTEYISDNMPAIREKIDDAITFAEEAFNNFGDAIQFVKDNMDIILPVIGGVTAAVTAQLIINSVKAGYDAFTKSTIITTIAQKGLTAAMAAHPFGLAAIAIGLLVTAGIALYKNWDTIKEKGSELKEKVLELVDGAITWGTDIVEGLWDGILGSKDWLLGKIGEWADSIAKGFKDFFGIASPSKLMAMYGQYIAEGLAGGIKNNANKPISEMVTLSEAITGALQKVNEFVSGTVGVIEKEFDLWVLKNDAVAESSIYLEQQLEMQRQKHELLNGQIAATSNALNNAINIYGAGSIESLNYKNSLLDLQIQQENLAGSIAKTNSELVNQNSLTIGANSFSIGNVTYGLNSSSVRDKTKAEKEKFKDEISAIATANGKDLSVGYDMFKQNQLDKIYGREETYSSKGITQNITVNSPKALSPYEMAREAAKASVKLVLPLLR